MLLFDVTKLRNIKAVTVAKSPILLAEIIFPELLRAQFSFVFRLRFVFAVGLTFTGCN
ncbi:hypothetical protein D3C84_836410 [compost metagenome]